MTPVDNTKSTLAPINDATAKFGARELVREVAAGINVLLNLLKLLLNLRHLLLSVLFDVFLQLLDL